MHLKNQSPNTTTSRRFRFIHSQNLWNRSLQELTQLAVIYLGNKVKRTKDRTEDRTEDKTEDRTDDRTDDTTDDTTKERTEDTTEDRTEDRGPGGTDNGRGPGPSA